MTVLWFGLAVLGGLLIGMQPSVNARLAAHLGHPLSASLVSFATATVLLALLALVLRPPVPALAAVRAVPPWVWLGGALGAGFVTIALMATPRLGAAMTVALLVAGQLTASIAIDHWGLFGLPVRPVDWAKALGVLCLVAGVVLIRWR